MRARNTEWQRQQWASNPEYKARKTQHIEKYRERNRDHVANHAKRYQAEHADRVRENKRRYSASDKGKIAKRAREHTRRARKRAVPGKISAAAANKLLAAASRCAICGRRFTKANPATIDHVLAISTDLGSNHLSNLAAVHAVCNSKKGSRRENPLTGPGLLL